MKLFDGTAQNHSSLSAAEIRAAVAVAVAVVVSSIEVDILPALNSNTDFFTTSFPDFSFSTHSQ